MDDIFECLHKLAGITILDIRNKLKLLVIPMHGNNKNWATLCDIRGGKNESTYTIKIAADVSKQPQLVN